MAALPRVRAVLSLGLIAHNATLKAFAMRTSSAKFAHQACHDIAPGINYRFQLTYRSLALQQLWVHSKTHVALWPGIGDCLLDQNFQVLNPAGIGLHE